MTANSDAYAALQNYFNNKPLMAPQFGGLSTPSIANSMLLNAQRNTLGPGQPNPNSPSILGRIFDLLSRPNYAIANFAKGEVTGSTNPIGDILSGLAGTQKTTFNDVLKEAGIPDSPLRSGLGLALDIGLDPTTYLGGEGILSKLKNIVKPAEDAVKELPAGAKLLQNAEPINPEVFGLTNKAPEIPNVLKSEPLVGSSPDLGIEASLRPNKIDAVLNPERTRLPQTIEDLANKAKPNIVPEQLPLDLPGIPKRDVTFPEAFRPKESLPPEVTSQVKGQLPFKFGSKFKLADVRAATKANELKNAEDIIKGISQGNVNDALRLKPPPPISYHPGDAKLAQEISSRFDPSKATAQINKDFSNTLNAKQQVKLYYQAKEALGKKGAMSARRVNPVYKAIEDQMIKRGFVPRIGTGENVKLSNVIEDLRTKNIPVSYDVLKEFGDKIDKTSPVGQAVENLRARGALNESVPVQKLTDTISNASKDIEASNTLTDKQMKNVNSLLKKLGKKTASSVGLSPAAQKTSEGLISQAMIAGKPAAQVILDQKSKLLDDIIAGGRTKRQEINEVVTHALEKNLGKLPKWVVDEAQNKAVDFGMARIATWWGQKDLRPMSLEALASSAATAQARGKVLNNIFKPFNTAERAEALSLAQGFGKASGSATEALGGQISKMMEDLTSVITKSSLDMGFLNKWMRKYGTDFQFTKGNKVKDLTGKVVDFSKGTDWLQSWKTAQVKQDAAEWIFKVQQAIEQATREKSMFDEMGERFGSPLSGKGFKVKIEGHPYLNDYFFPEDIAKQIPRVIKDWTFHSYQTNKALAFYDRMLSMWKTNATIYRPSYYFRNIVGDAYLGLLDNVYSIKPYQLALRVQRSMPGAYKDLTDIDKLVELGAMSRKTSTPVPGETLFKNKSGIPFTAEQIKAAAHERGLFESFKTLQDIISTGKKGKFGVLTPLQGKAQDFAGRLTELQSANGRLAHFIDKVMKSKGSDLPKIFDEASRRARKFHPSGLDLTDFEKNYLRRIMPFYSWLRKSTPLLLEGIVMKPGITVLPAKVSGAIQEAAGVQTSGRDNPFPVNQMFPKWLRDQALGPLSLPNGFLGKFSDQTPPGYVMAGVGLNPLSQLFSQAENPGQNIGGMLSPVLQTPIELITGQRLFTRQPILGPDAQPGAFSEYLGQHLPFMGPIQAVTGITPFGTPTKTTVEGMDARKEDIINWLTGLGIRGTGQFIKSAQFENKAPIQNQQKYNQDLLLSQIRAQMGGW